MTGGPQGGVLSSDLDPSTALDLDQAARLAGVERGTIEAAITQGRLRHEVARHAGRETRIVRLVDLADVFPVEGFGAAEESGRGADEEPASPGAAGTRTDSAGISAEARWAALTVRNESLEEQIDDLREQRRGLEGRCVELSDRLAEFERDRAAGTAALFVAQRRLVELEARALPAPGAGAVRGSRLRDPRVWLALAVLGLGFTLWRGRTAHAATLGELRSLDARLGTALDHGERERSAFETRLGELTDVVGRSHGDLTALRRELARERTLRAALERRADPWTRLRSAAGAWVERAARGLRPDAPE